MPNFLALYIGTPTDGPPKDMSPETIKEGMQAWADWMQEHAAAVVVQGGPVGRTKQVSKVGHRRHPQPAWRGFVVVEAASAEAAAKMFKATRTSPSSPARPSR